MMAEKEIDIPALQVELERLKGKVKRARGLLFLVFVLLVSAVGAGVLFAQENLHWYQFIVNSQGDTIYRVDKITGQISSFDEYGTRRSRFLSDLTSPTRKKEVKQTFIGPRYTMAVVPPTTGSKINGIGSPRNDGFVVVMDAATGRVKKLTESSTDYLVDSLLGNL